MGRMSPSAWGAWFTGIGLLAGLLVFAAKVVAKLTRLVDAVETNLPNLIRATMRDHIDTMHRENQPAGR